LKKIQVPLLASDVSGLEALLDFSKYLSKTGAAERMEGKKEEKEKRVKVKKVG
jgi:hypothetical protein